MVPSRRNSEGDWDAVARMSSENTFQWRFTPEAGGIQPTPTSHEIFMAFEFGVKMNRCCECGLDVDGDLRDDVESCYCSTCYSILPDFFKATAKGDTR